TIALRPRWGAGLPHKIEDSLENEIACSAPRSSRATCWTSGSTTSREGFVLSDGYVSPGGGVVAQALLSHDVRALWRGAFRRAGAAYRRFRGRISRMILVS